MTRIPPARLARDRAGVVALTLITIGLPARVWTVLAMPASAEYRVYPAWAQCLLMAAYAGQLGAEAWGDQRSRATAAALSAMAAGMSAVLFWYGDSTSGGVVTWAAQASMQLLICFAVAREIGRRDACAIWKG